MQTGFLLEKKEAQFFWENNQVLVKYYFLRTKKLIIRVLLKN